MTGKPFQCKICWAYKGTQAGHLRNHYSQTNCGAILRAQSATKPKKRTVSVEPNERENSPTSSIHSSDFPIEPAITNDTTPIFTPPPPKQFRVSNEEVEDEGEFVARLSRDNFVSRDFVGAGAVVSESADKKNMFQRYKEEKEKKGIEIWAPYKSREEWQLARWLMLSGVSQGNVDSFAKLPIIREKLEPSFKDKRTFFKKIDELPTVRGGWTCRELKVTGNIMQKGSDGEEIPMCEEIDLWYRNPVDCIQELMEDPQFKDHMCYAPEQMFTDESLKVRAVDEMWTGDWWWATQKLLPLGATIAPIILASDKTQLSTFSGDKSAWPVYLTIGNIKASVRRKPSEQASVLVGYIPVSKLECFTKGIRSEEGYRLFHDCMRILLEPLVAAGDSIAGGIEMLCSDGMSRLVFPLLAAYVADFPEQCLVAGCQERRCPKCEVEGKGLGDPLHSILRDPEKTIRALRRAADGDKHTAEVLGLREITPFWRDLPLCNIFHCFTPDILHQLHKGVFKDHIVKWSTESIPAKNSKEEIDVRFQTIPHHHSLRHFKKGISLISQWTGNEYKNMEKVFLAVIAGAAPPDAVICVRAVLEFIEYAQFELHTDESLQKMDTALQTFHAHKDAAFVETEIRNHFNIPKVHSMNHYVSMIRSHGVAPGFNTEWSERLHIEFAKQGYRASNKRDYIEQMTTWLDRREKVLWFTRFLDWTLDKDTVDWLGTASNEENREDDSQPIVDSGVESSQDDTRTELLYGESKCLTAKRPSFLNIDLETLDSKYGCSSFVYAMERFLRQHNLLKPNYWDATPAKYNLYKRIRIIVPPTPEITDLPVLDLVRATAAQPAKGKRKKYTPAQFDTVLARKVLPSSRKEDLNELGPNGLHVAQVHAIFTLPEELGEFPHPLAYVEWFTPLRKIDGDTLMYRVQRSCAKNGVRTASIIPVTYISRSCHLIPFYGKCADRGWNSETVLEQFSHEDSVSYRQVSTSMAKNYRKHSDYIPASSSTYEPSESETVSPLRKRPRRHSPAKISYSDSDEGGSAIVKEEEDGNKINNGADEAMELRAPSASGKQRISYLYSLGLDDSQKESQEYYDGMRHWNETVQHVTSTKPASNADSKAFSLYGHPEELEEQSQVVPDAQYDKLRKMNNDNDRANLDRNLYEAESSNAELRAENSQLQKRITVLESEVAKQKEKEHMLEDIMARTSDILGSIAAGAFDRERLLGQLNMYLVSQLTDSQTQT